MSGMANEIAARMREDGVNLSQTPDAALGGGATQEGTGEPTATPAPGTPAGAQNTDTGNGGEPGPIPYSRFAEVNAERKALQDKWGVLEQFGIEPDSAVRLANFEAAYQQDPTGTVATMVDQLDLPDANKTALKALLESAAGATAQSDQDNGSTPAPAELPAEVKEAIGWINEQRTNAAETESQARLDQVVSHWKSLDTQDNIEVPERQRLLYIQQTAADNAGTFQSLEQLAEAARAEFLKDRDVLLGAAIQRRGPGSPLSVPSRGAPPAQAIIPKSMGEARKLIEADIAAGLFPDLQTGG